MTAPFLPYVCDVCERVVSRLFARTLDRARPFHLVTNPSVVECRAHVGSWTGDAASLVAKRAARREMA